MQLDYIQLLFAAALGSFQIAPMGASAATGLRIDDIGRVFINRSTAPMYPTHMLNLYGSLNIGGDSSYPGLMIGAMGVDIPEQGYGLYYDYNSKYACRGGLIDSGKMAPGVVGNYSFVFGSYSEAQGDNSVAFGQAAKANGENTFAFGAGAEVTGNGGVAIGASANTSGILGVALGQNAQAGGSYSFAAQGGATSGTYSFALGNGANASGAYSYAIGRAADADGNDSLAIGYGTASPTIQEISLGSYPTVYAPTGDASTWNATDRLLGIGNGQNSGARSMAITILKNGNIGIGNSAEAQAPGSTLVIDITALPTSAPAQSGAVWRDASAGNVLKIVP